MKRDMDVVRQIVLAVRDASGVVRAVPGIDDATFIEHAQLLHEAGLIEASIQVVQHRATVALIWRLTWGGQDFAQSVADDTLWRKAKENVIKPLGSWTFAVLGEYLKGEIMRRVIGPA